MGKVRFIGASAAALIAIGAAGAAHAQDEAPVAETATTPDDDDVIYVTAQRRSQLLIDVPQSVSAVGEATLERQQADSFLEYAPLVPGLSIEQSTPGESRVILRGVNTGSVGSTVGIYVDETPFGSSTSLGNAAVLAGDFDTFDLARVEVVRGPQGTLYGSNALGGVLKFVTNAPDPSGFEARVQGGLESVQDGGLGWSGNAMVNVPLGDTIAVRGSGFYRHNPGYIDRIGLPGEDVNESDSYGGRVSLLFEPTDALSVRLTALAQNIRVDSASSFDADAATLEPIDVDPATGAAIGDRLVRTEFFPVVNEVDYRLYNGTINWDLGFGTLTSATSYGTLDQLQLIDNSAALGPTISGIYSAFAGITEPLGIFLDAQIDQEKFTQEIRLASPDSDRFEWLVGAYYTNESVAINQFFRIFEIDTLVIRDPALLGQAEFLFAQLESDYEEIAGFANLTWHVTDQFALSAGGRYSENEQSSSQIIDGAFPLLTGGTPGQLLIGDSDEGVFTWSLSALYEASDTTSLYARVAKGYRPGGPNVVPPGAGPDFPFQFVADTLISYEAGIRTQTADRVFAIDASAYFLDWSNILVFAAFPTAVGDVGANANGQGARSFGFEATASIRPTRGLSIVINAAANHSELTDDTPPVTGGFDGDRLPFSPKFSGNISADYEWGLSGNAIAFVGGNLRMVSQQAAGFDSTFLATFGRQPQIPGYEAIDLRAGVELERFTVTAFVRNLTDSGGLTSLGAFTPGLAISASAIRPRTFGVTVGANF